ncbi:MAG TPA: hypothetical protein VNI58_00885 [Mariprofundaceae bacterium]|nr:hypothetical protein [Mariprofundaceae bacterium]
MSICLNCGVDFEGEVGLCAACKKQEALQRAKGVWKKQIRFYSAMMLVGIVILGFAIFRIHGTHDDLSREMYLVSSLGGLFLLGGLFGLSLAMFFHLWHGGHRQ